MGGGELGSCGARTVAELLMVEVDVEAAEVVVEAAEVVVVVVVVMFVVIVIAVVVERGWYLNE